MKVGARVDDLLRLLLWEGRLRNSRIRRLFGLGTVRSSQLIQEFRAAHPETTLWDSKRKAFVATPRAYVGRKAVQSSAPLSLESYLTLLGAAGALDDGILVQAHRDLTPARPGLFAFLQSAIAERTWARLSYRSMSTPQPHERTVMPRTLVRAGVRWHLRAFTLETDSFRDYNLGRIAKWAPAQVQHPLPRDDAWETRVPVRLIPHPGLTAEQEDLVRYEYMNGAASRTETTRAALIPYLVQDFRAATDVAKQRPPEFQLAVFNLDEVGRWLWA